MILHDQDNSSIEKKKFSDGGFMLDIQRRQLIEFIVAKLTDSDPLIASQKKPFT